jgi:hypothetical protein
MQACTLRRYNWYAKAPVLPKADIRSSSNKCESTLDYKPRPVELPCTIRIQRHFNSFDAGWSQFWEPKAETQPRAPVALVRTGSRQMFHVSG